MTIAISDFLNICLYARSSWSFCFLSPAACSCSRILPDFLPSFPLPLKNAPYDHLGSSLNHLQSRLPSPDRNLIWFFRSVNCVAHHRGYFLSHCLNMYKMFLNVFFLTLNWCFIWFISFNNSFSFAPLNLSWDVNLWFWTVKSLTSWLCLSTTSLKLVISACRSNILWSYSCSATSSLSWCFSCSRFWKEMHFMIII